MGQDGMPLPPPEPEFEVMYVKFKDRAANLPTYFTTDSVGCTESVCTCEQALLVEKFCRALVTIAECRSRMCPYLLDGLLNSTSELDLYGVHFRWLEIGELIKLGSTYSVQPSNNDSNTYNDKKLGIVIEDESSPATASPKPCHQVSTDLSGTEGKANGPSSDQSSSNNLPESERFVLAGLRIEKRKTSRSKQSSEPEVEQIQSQNNCIENTGEVVLAPAVVPETEVDLNVTPISADEIADVELEPVVQETEADLNVSPISADDLAVVEPVVPETEANQDVSPNSADDLAEVESVVLETEANLDVSPKSADDLAEVELEPVVPETETDLNVTPTCDNEEVSLNSEPAANEDTEPDSPSYPPEEPLPTISELDAEAAAVVVQNVHTASPTEKTFSNSSSMQNVNANTIVESVCNISNVQESESEPPKDARLSSEANTLDKTSTASEINSSVSVAQVFKRSATEDTSETDSDSTSHRPTTKKPAWGSETDYFGGRIRWVVKEDINHSPTSKRKIKFGTGNVARVRESLGWRSFSSSRNTTAADQQENDLLPSDTDNEIEELPDNVSSSTTDQKTRAESHKQSSADITNNRGVSNDKRVTRSGQSPVPILLEQKEPGVRTRSRSSLPGPASVKRLRESRIAKKAAQAKIRSSFVSDTGSDTSSVTSSPVKGTATPSSSTPIATGVQRKRLRTSQETAQDKHNTKSSVNNTTNKNNSISLDILQRETSSDISSFSSRSSTPDSHHQSHETRGRQRDSSSPITVTTRSQQQKTKVIDHQQEKNMDKSSAYGIANEQEINVISKESEESSSSDSGESHVSEIPLQERLEKKKKRAEKQRRLAYDGREGDKEEMNDGSRTILSNESRKRIIGINLCGERATTGFPSQTLEQKLGFKIPNLPITPKDAQTLKSATAAILKSKSLQQPKVVQTVKCGGFVEAGDENAANKKSSPQGIAQQEIMTHVKNTTSNESEESSSSDSGESHVSEIPLQERLEKKKKRAEKQRRLAYDGREGDKEEMNDGSRTILSNESRKKKRIRLNLTGERATTGFPSQTLEQKLGFKIPNLPITPKDAQSLKSATVAILKSKSLQQPKESQTEKGGGAIEDDDDIQVIGEMPRKTTGASKRTNCTKASTIDPSKQNLSGIHISLKKKKSKPMALRRSCSPPVPDVSSVTTKEASPNIDSISSNTSSGKNTRTKSTSLPISSSDDVTVSVSSVSEVDLEDHSRWEFPHLTSPKKTPQVAATPTPSCQRSANEQTVTPSFASTESCPERESSTSGSRSIVPTDQTSRHLRARKHIFDPKEEAAKIVPKPIPKVSKELIQQQQKGDGSATSTPLFYGKLHGATDEGKSKSDPLPQALNQEVSSSSTPCKNKEAPKTLEGSEQRTPQKSHQDKSQVPSERPTHQQANSNSSSPKAPGTGPQRISEGWQRGSSAPKPTRNIGFADGEIRIMPKPSTRGSSRGNNNATWGGGSGAGVATATSTASSGGTWRRVGTNEAPRDCGREVPENTVDFENPPDEEVRNRSNNRNERNHNRGGGSTDGFRGGGNRHHRGGGHQQSYPYSGVEQRFSGGIPQNHNNYYDSGGRGHPRSRPPFYGGGPRQFPNPPRWPRFRM